MYEFFKEAINRAHTFTGLSGANSHWDQQPDNPKKVEKPTIVFTLDLTEDNLGDHGASISPTLEVDIWGYYGNEGAELEEVFKAMNQLDLALLKRIKLSDIDGKGVSTRFRSLGWSKVGDPSDSNVIRYRNNYITKYWSLERAEFLAQE